jgi:serine protease
VNAALPVATVPAQNETESNNFISTANAVNVSGTVVSGSIASTSDTDYYVVQVPAGRTLTATLAPNAGSDFDLYAYNGSGTQLAVSTNGMGASDAVSTANTAGATQARYVRVRYHAGATGAANGKYSLKFTW